MNAPALQVGFVLFPRLTQLDLTAPWELFARLPGVQAHLAWKTLDPVLSDTGLAILPGVTFADCPDLDVLCVPGGPGVNALLDDAETLAFVRSQGQRARWVTSVCSGALVLGAAGLLRGYRATTHWASLDFLAAFGATAERSRVCVDRNRVTGGGVTAGLDFGLHLAAELAGRATAERIQLYIEYDPAPPLHAGSPDTAPPDVLPRYRELAAPMLEERRQAVARAAARLG